MSHLFQSLFVLVVLCLNSVAFADQQSASCSVSYIPVNGGFTVKGPPPQIFNTSGSYAPIKDKGLIFQATLSMADASFIELSITKDIPAGSGNPMVANFAGNVDWIKSNKFAQIVAPVDASLNVLFSCYKQN